MGPVNTDWFNPKHAGFEERMKDRGQRLVSFFVYLSGCEVCITVCARRLFLQCRVLQRSE